MLKNSASFSYEAGRQQRHLEPLTLECVRDHDRLPAGHRDQAHAPARRRLAVRERVHRVDRLVEALRLHDARLPHRGVPDRRRGRQRSRVRVDRTRAGAGHAALPDDDRLSLRRLLYGAEEAPPVLHALDVHGDDLGLRVVREVLDVVRRVEDDGVAEAHRLRALHASHGADEREVDGVRSALGDEADVARVTRGLVGAVPDAEPPVVDAHAVRADQQQPGLSRHLRDLLLRRDPVLRLRLGEART